MSSNRISRHGGYDTRSSTSGSRTNSRDIDCSTSRYSEGNRRAKPITTAPAQYDLTRDKPAEDSPKRKDHDGHHLDTPSKRVKLNNSQQTSSKTVHSSLYNGMVKKIDRLQGAYTRKQEELDECKQDINRLEQRMQSYLTVNNDRTAQVWRLEEQIRQLQESGSSRGGLLPSVSVQQATHEHQAEIKKWEQRCQQFEATLASKEKQFLEARAEFVSEMQASRGSGARKNPKVSDNEISRRWKQLVFQIRQFVDNYSTPVFDLPKESEELWTSMMPNPAIFFASPDLSPLVFEAHIWSFLYKHIFDKHSKTWAGDLGKSFSKFSGGVLGKFYSFVILNIFTNGFLGLVARDPSFFVEYHDWRSRSAVFLTRLSPHEDNVSQHHDLVSLMIRELFELHQDTDKMDLNQVKDDAMGIFNEAMELDLIFRQSRAHFDFIFSMPSRPDVSTKHGFEFDPVCMIMLQNARSVSNDGEPKVDLIVSPALLKRGNNDGAHFDQISWVFKMGVICNVAQNANEGKADASNGPYVKKEAQIKTEDGDGDEVMLLGHK